MSPTAPVTRAEIIKAFAIALETRTLLKLHNVFRGVPVIFPAQVTSIGFDTVALKVHCLQSVVISIEKRTYIQSKTLPIILRAFPKTVNFNHQEVVLTNFTPAGKVFVERTHLRVQPKEPVNVSILSGDSTIPGTMADISVSRAGVFVLGVYILGQFSVGLASAARVGLDLSLPGSDQSINLVGTLSSINREKGMKMTRIGIETSPEPVFETALVKYIDQRQVEILDELQKIYQRTCPSRQD